MANQITGRSIKSRYDRLSSKEKQDIANRTKRPVADTELRVLALSKAIDRVFVPAADVENLQSQNLINRNDHVMVSVHQFADALLGMDFSPADSVLGSELLGRELASQLEIPRESVNSSFDELMSNVSQKTMKAAQNASKISKTASEKTAAAGEIDVDPILTKSREYIFPDAFAVIKGPKRIEVINFNKDVMSANVTLSTDINPGTFSITLSNPHEVYVDDYGFYTFATGDMIRIHATTRFKQEEDRYAQIFWGIIERIQDDYNDGETRITLSGQDVTAWFQYTTIRPTPTLLERLINPGIDVLHAGHKYAGKTVLEMLADIIFNDVKDFNALTSYSLEQANAGQFDQLEQAIADLQEEKRKNGKLTAAQQAELDKKAADAQKLTGQAGEDGSEGIVEWWKTLFLNDLVVKIFAFDSTVSPLEITSSNASNGASFSREGKMIESLIQDLAGKEQTVRALTFDQKSRCAAVVALSKYVPIRIFADNPFGGIWQLEDVPKIEVIRRITEGTMFEFFMDRDGAIVFKPPFYNEYPANNDTKKYQSLIEGLSNCKGGFEKEDLMEEGEFRPATAYQYIIEEKDILSWSIVEDSAAIVSRQEVLGEPKEFSSVAAFHYGAAQNNDLVRRYGLRVGSPKKQRMIDNTTDAIVFAKALMDYANTKFYTGTITIIGRPELHLGRTIYVPSRNVIFYVTGITHSYTAGGTFTSSLTCVAGRRMMLDASGKVRENVFDGEQFLDQDIKDGDARIAEKESQIKENIELRKSLGADAESGDFVPNEETQAIDETIAKYMKELEKLKRQQVSRKNKKKTFDKIKKDKSYSAEDVSELGAPPRRISDTFGRRLYGMLPYGLITKPEEKNSSPESGGSTDTPTARPDSKVSIGQNSAGASSPINPFVSSASEKFREAGKASAGAGGGAGGKAKQRTGQPFVSETAKSCVEEKESKAFNPSSIVKRRVVKGGAF